MTVGRRALVAGILTVLLSGCAVTPERATLIQIPWRDRAQMLSAIDAFEIKSKLGVTAPDQHGQGTMIWKRDGTNHHINLYGPLGGGSVILSHDGNSAELRDGQHTYFAETLEEVLYDVLGWHVPFSSMTYWIVGLPAPNEPYTHTVDEWGRLSTLEQSGWRIRYAAYRTATRYELPEKIFLEFVPARDRTATASYGSDPVKVRLAIKQWNL